MPCSLPTVDPAARHDPPELVCVGASVRGFAASAVRAGWRVHAADLFGDVDLLAVAASFAAAGGRHTPYPDSLADLVADFPAAPWCYTGALENHPDLVDRIATVRPLAGNRGPALRAVRDPENLGAILRDAGLHAPDTFPTPAGLPRDGSILCKPRSSAGGRGIVPWHGTPTTSGDDRIWQRRIAGSAWAAAFVCDRRAARLWGVSRQLVGRRWCHAGAFAYCGSIDVHLAEAPPEIVAACRRLAPLLTEAFGLVGLVGVDLVVDAARRVHVIEVNPRPTASMELIERSTGTSMAATHLAACGVTAAPRHAAAGAPGGTWAKAVLFAAHDTAIDPRVGTSLAASAARWGDADGLPAVADIPPPATFVPAGRPLLTLFAHGGSPVAARRALRARVTELDGLVSAGQPARP